MKTISIEEYEEYAADYYGICLKCGEVREQCEPDAEGYECYDCGEHAVQGIENALICGNIEVE